MNDCTYLLTTEHFLYLLFNKEIEIEIIKMEFLLKEKREQMRIKLLHVEAR